MARTLYHVLQLSWFSPTVLLFERTERTPGTLHCVAYCSVCTHYNSNLRAAGIVLCTTQFTADIKRVEEGNSERTRRVGLAELGSEAS